VKEILSHHQARQRLWSAMRNGALHHAYLFEGPRGVGKSLVALRLVQAANCDSGEPCGICATCQAIANNRHPDIIFVEPDPTRATPIISVDAIREVVRQTTYHRYGSKRRFVIIDPAEAMQVGAANALLKTLEEPPPYTGFILIANHAKALLPTIVSRCQRTRFGAVASDELEQWLNEQGVDQASIVAHLSQGCPGRALELADGGLEQRLQRRDNLLGVLNGPLDGIFEWSRKICDGKKRQQWMVEVEAILEVVEDLLRDVVILGCGADKCLLNGDATALVEQWGKALWPYGVVRANDALNEARAQLRLNVSGRTVIDALLTTLRQELS
jgi:DNA polymerase III subunit delta'